MYNVCSVYRGRGGGGERGVFSTSVRYHEYIGRYHEYIGRCSVHQRVSMMQVGDIMIHVGGYHEHIRGCSVH